MKIRKGSWEEGRVENSEFAMKDLPLGRILLLIDWLIQWHILQLYSTLFVSLHLQKNKNEQPDLCSSFIDVNAYQVDLIYFNDFLP